MDLRYNEFSRDAVKLLVFLCDFVSSMTKRLYFVRTIIVHSIPVFETWIYVLWSNITHSPIDTIPAGLCNIIIRIWNGYYCLPMECYWFSRIRFHNPPNVFIWPFTLILKPIFHENTFWKISMHILCIRMLGFAEGIYKRTENNKCYSRDADKTRLLLALQPINGTRGPNFSSNFNPFLPTFEGGIGFSLYFWSFNLNRRCFWVL